MWSPGFSRAAFIFPAPSRWQIKKSSFVLLKAKI
jgi:hypothetical protein